MGQKIGQLFVVGFDGTETTPALRSFMRDEAIGGIILFRRNCASKGQLTRLIGRLKEEAEGGPPIVSIDQEGGRVQRLPRSFGRFPSMAEVGVEAQAADDPAVAYRAGEHVACALRELGINLDYAPVLDVSTNPFNPVIGDRAFGYEADFVAELGAQFIRGLMEGGVLACGKHFPGHGDTDADSHTELPILPHTRRRFEVCEWKPFQAAIACGVPAMMTAHVLAPNLDPTFPASVSRAITTGLLRRELGFDGVIITDDLTMKGIECRMAAGEAAVRSIAAGADIVLICSDEKKQREAVDAVKRAVDEGVIPEHRITESLARISKLKNSMIIK